MNENENLNPFEANEDNFSAPVAEDSDIPASFEEPQAFEDISSYNDEASFTEPEPVNEEIFPEAPSFEQELPEEKEITESFISNEAPEEKVAEAFNPYAPKNDASSAYPFNNVTNNNYSQVNPSYNQPVNNYPRNNPQGNFNQGFNYNNYQQDNFNPYQQPPAPKSNKGGKLIATAIVAVCVIVGVIALVSSLFGSGDTPTTSYPTESTTYGDSAAVTQAPPTTVFSGNTATTDPSSINGSNSIWVAEKVRPSVVGVLAYQQGELAGEGSGVLMSEDLSSNTTYVITCAHVINEPGCEFAVLLLDGRSFEAKVVALDERTDIGVLKVSATGLPLAEFGESSSLKIGEPIYAIGNPGGSEYFGSITNGIVSAIDRSISATYTMTCIQHNAAINPGNSGGALVNTSGQIIGINSSKIAKTDYEGMGFAVPSAIFKPVVQALIQYGYVPNRPELGIKYASVSDYQLYSLIVSIKGLPRESIIIAEIPEGSALSGTEAQVGDLIIAVNGNKMDSADVLLDLIDTGAVGDTLTLTLCRVQSRSYETTTFDVTVQLVEDKGSITTTTQAATLPAQDDYYSNFGDFFDYFGW